MRFIESAPAATARAEHPPRAAAAAAAAAATPRTLRVLMVVESAAGGTGRHVLDLSEGLIRRGCEVHVAYSTGRVDGQFLAGLSRLPEIRRLALPMRTSPHPSDWSAVRAVRHYALEHGPFDAIHGHSSKGGAVARLATFRTGAAAFYTLHGLIMMDPGLPRWKWALYLGIELALARRTSRVIAVSPEEARAAVRLGFGQSRVVLIPNGVRDLHLTPRAEARRSLGVADDALLVGFVGRLVEQKAPEILIRSIARVAKAVPGARLVVVGSGPLGDSLRELAAQLHVADRIHWLGECDARQYLAAFDAFALPSRKEGLPYVILEALAAGLPVVATDSAGVEILVKTGENGIVVPRDDAGAFGNALAELLADPLRLARYAAASHHRAERFTVDAMVERMLAAYRGEPVTPFDA
jgi:glycosyltransferase involved in cell wall biosynthesis